MIQVPIMFVGDSPDTRSGLARIGRDLACLLSREPQFRVGYLGLGGGGSRQLPFSQYTIQQSHQLEWGSDSIARAWGDFAGDRKGVVMTIWDASRLMWFAKPETLRESDPELHRFLTSRHFVRWGYFPIDSTGPGDRLTVKTEVTLQGYDRVLAYTKWAKGLVMKAVSGGVDWLPHGFNGGVFVPRDKRDGRATLSARLHRDDFVIGVVGTNQARKDWGLIAQTCCLLAQRHPHVMFWWHTDLIERHWSFPALLADYGLGDRMVVTSDSPNDTVMSYRYSACDLTLAPGLGEGFGYPIVESLACGVPVVHGDYGGGADLMRQWGTGPWSLVEPSEYRVEGLHNCIRPVYDPNDWVEAVEQVMAGNPQVVGGEAARACVEHLEWKRLWPGAWLPWFMRGLR